ncbi:hypothetical protein PIB30_080184 [Stylosanthes scabra]|uniref:Putative plant transposon protein domain-containing protein n=1 Tax=Stylosanthes scabra TaxID=79078 RepID=A0ABU6ZQ45_9FABA|nr:hypothetical protein [Stylosanthes scabra]
MASSSAPASVFDDYRFRTEFNQTLFESIVRKKKVTLEVGFNLDEDEYPQIKEQIALRGWRRLAAPITDISKLLVQEFYANAAVSDKEMKDAGQLPYKSYVRGVEVDFSPENIRRVMRFKEETPGVETDYTTRQATDQRLDEVLADLCIPCATWKLSSSQPTVPIQLRRAELFPLAWGWQEFTIHFLVPTGNKSEITVARAILIHSIMKGEELRVENIIADNMAVIAQGLHGKGKLGFPSTVYKLCKDARMQGKEQDMLAREIQEIRKGQINQTLMNTQRAEAEKNLEQAVEKQARELAEMKKQLNLWTRNASAREAYPCWAHQQANPNLSEIPINHIPDLMQTNAEKGMPMFYGALMSHVGASASSQSA